MIRRMDAVTSPPRERGPSQDRTAEPRRTTAGWTSRLRLPSRPWLQFLAFFAVLALVLVLVRGDLLWTSGMQNPDEAELMAEGRSAAGNLFPYSDYTTSTHLFLWPFLLGLLGLVGVPLTLVTAHVISGLSYVLLGTTGWFLTMRRIGGLRATFLVLPTTLVLLMGYGPGTSDFLSMTSEALPLVFLCVAALVMLGPSHPMTNRQLVIGSMIAGLAIWTKPQSGPVAAAFVGACVLMACVEHERARGAASRTGTVPRLLRSMALAVLAFVTPTVVFVGMMMLGGTLDEFVREPVASMWGYAAHRDVSQGIVAPPLTGRLAGVAGFASSFPFALAWALGALLSTALLARLGSRLLRGLGLAAILLPLGSALICLLPIYPLFPHYAKFLYVGCLLATCVAVRLAVAGQRRPAGGKWVEGTYGAVALRWSGCSCCLRSGADEGPGQEAGTRSRGKASPSTTRSRARRRARRGLSVGQPGAGVGMGVGARRLLRLDSREPVRQHDLDPEPQRQAGGVRLDPGGELRQDPPGCIVEALGPPFFAGIDPANTLTTLVPDRLVVAGVLLHRSDETTFDGRRSGSTTARAPARGD